MSVIFGYVKENGTKHSWKVTNTDVALDQMKELAKDGGYKGFFVVTDDEIHSFRVDNHIATMPNRVNLAGTAKLGA